MSPVAHTTLAPGEAAVVIPAHRLSSVVERGEGIEVTLVVDERLAIAMVNALNEEAQQ